MKNINFEEFVKSFDLRFKKEDSNLYDVSMHSDIASIDYPYIAEITRDKDSDYSTNWCIDDVEYADNITDTLNQVEDDFETLVKPSLIHWYKDLMSTENREDRDNIYNSAPYIFSTKFSGKDLLADYH